MATIEEKENMIKVLKEGPYKYYKVVVRRATVSETEYLVKHKVSEGEFDAYEYTRDLEWGEPNDNWREEHTDHGVDSYEPEIESVEECDEHGNEVK